MSVVIAEKYLITLEEDKQTAHSTEPEAALTRPVADLLEQLVDHYGIGKLRLFREAQLIGVRPDFAASIDGRPCGWVELKAPGHSVAGETWTGREKKQWEHLSQLDSLLVTNGTTARLYQLGIQVREDVALPQGDPSEWDHKPLVALVSQFVSARPPILKRVSQLAERMAPMARMLRDRIEAGLRPETQRPAIVQAQELWAAHVHERATGLEFASDLAQVIAYSLAIAALRGDADTNADGYITIAEARNELRDRNAVLAAALGPVLDVDGLAADLSAEIGALERLASVVDAASIAKSKDARGEPWLWFYEDFLAKYDPVARDQAGVYYTPTAIVRMQVRHIDFILREVMGKKHSFGDKNVVTLDPCAGSGTYPLAVLDKITEVAILERGIAGPKQVATHVTDNLLAFELLPGPYAVAQLRIGQRLAEMAGSLFPPKNVRVYLTNTLDDPETAPSPAALWGDVAVLAAERERARTVKNSQKVTVVLGNPPYARGAGVAGKWVVNNGHGRAIFADVIEPAQNANVVFAAQASLYDMYVYFWRWALWKAFENPDADEAIVSFISASSWLRGPAFLGLRKLAVDLADEIWVTDLGGDGRGNADENVFAIQSAVAVVTLYRRKKKSTEPATVYYRRIQGTRGEKLSQMEDISPPPEGPEHWTNVDLSATKGRFVPITGAATWQEIPLITDLFPWQQPGCKFGRTWPIAPAPELLCKRWEEFLADEDASARAKKFVTGTSGRNIQTLVRGRQRLSELPNGAKSEPIGRYGYRSFDRQWILEDPRLAKTESPSLWFTRSSKQAYLTGMLTKPMGSGPALTVTTGIPDLDYFSGRGGKDVIPLYRDAAAETSNVTSGLLTLLAATFDKPVSVEDLAAYVFAVVAHPGYFERFADELETPGIRVPITKDPELFDEARRMGSKLLWLQTYAERFRDEGNKQGNRVPAVPGIAWEEPVTSLPASMADVSYDASTHRLLIGDGVLVGVRPDVWEFSVSRWRVLPKWIGYRTRTGIGRVATKPQPLDRIRPLVWADDWNDELLDLLRVLTLTIDCQSDQAELLAQIVESDSFKASDLPVPTASERSEPTMNQATAPTLI
ncbi:type ISP restriction/modification enzyme [Cryobacterium sp. 5B3]|uniref:type ISP restriction/modification enzyme n=1 Tax=Cryobacterium sp. 5B3 TaxID=3048586 RepID=UPI002AB579D5|nr:type ISP restriction/modification enzyme [Cryobacterium sp. 5B3]MDY7541832.1 type ISP restriction/modification enzyme [Cryobacterium sp. 5B3]MEB0274238.1 N-6 DNA methylase [Cryobacterium sp. 5B3]